MYTYIYIYIYNLTIVRNRIFYRMVNYTVENKNTSNEKVVIGYVMNNMRGEGCFDTRASLI